MGCRKPRAKRPSRLGETGFRLEHPGDPVPEDSRSKGARPWDPVWVGQAVRKRGMTAIHRNYNFGKDCNTTAVLFFYNKIHGFWDGSVYTPDGEPLPNADAIIRDILKRQIVSNGDLVRRTAKERKQAAKVKPCRVQKQTTDRNLRRRKPPAEAHRASHASPALTQITVAGSESVLGDGGANIWSVPGTPASPTAGLLDNSNDNEPDEPEDNDLDEEIAATGLAVSTADHDRHVLRRQQGPRTSPPAAEHDPEGEPYEARGGAEALAQDGAGESIHFREPQEPPAPHEFSAMMAGDDAWMNMDMAMSMTDFQGTADFDMDFLGDLNFDVDMAMNMPSSGGELQEHRGSHSPKAPTASSSATSAVASAASPHEAAGETRQTGNAAATDEPAPQPAPEPTNPNETTRASQPAPTSSAQAQRPVRQRPTSTETNNTSGQSKPPYPPATTTQKPYPCTPEEVMIAMQQALVSLIAERGWNLGRQDLGGVREPHPRPHMSIPVMA